ncbi:hypothetical protein A1Q1_07782 [Trichosporon asahii var. asahii CBS 2479]|uniref:Uncharacterized protein n=1 Tax=Trichosporon asahii var. asahii (strain ATCC 90039 / CBS 2479 / JCM 2466 / KCTC 7840 / NBRC 103889/ NCYC 2677 / UAMH 7654) TaxID=1186058 RepID=J5R6W6_TRIAS|nr:hypothetical protein A1Q1_07782 [Trichosporon asahii var. asahii CBS 2479]EJT50988.1 hypothetical protein A1Q1_07782 [Trichosporon asahii var. asahii CBS 2479]
MCFLHRLVRREQSQKSERTALLSGPAAGVTSVPISATTSETLGTSSTPARQTHHGIGRRIDNNAVDPVDPSTCLTHGAREFETPPVYERSPSYTPTPAPGERTLRSSVSSVPATPPSTEGTGGTGGTEGPEGTDGTDGTEGVHPPAYAKQTSRRSTLALFVEGDRFSRPHPPLSPRHLRPLRSLRPSTRPLHPKKKAKNSSLRADLLGHNHSSWSLSSDSSGLDSDSDSDSDSETDHANVCERVGGLRRERGELGSPWWAAAPAPVPVRCRS